MTLDDQLSSRDGAALPTEPITPSPLAPAPAGATRTEAADRLVHQEKPRDRIRWGTVWAGLLVTLASFVVLELAFLALGLTTLDQNQTGSAAGWISGLIGLVAFFLGGVTVGCTVIWRDLTDGVLHGMLVWALATVGMIFLTLLGGGALFGAVADVLTQVSSRPSPNLPDVQLAQVAAAAQSAAAWALLGLGLSFAAAAAGGATGVKLWPRKGDTDLRER